MNARILLALLVVLPATLANRTTAAASGIVTAERLTAVSPRTSCTALATADLSAATGAATTRGEASTVNDRAGNSYCRVRGRIAPQIHFEVHLPTSGWTQRYLQLGCGGLCGRVSLELDDHIASCAPAASASLVLASTDMGHDGEMSGAWADRNPQAKIDFGYRGVHLTALAAKALIQLYYGQPAKYAYFSGCSDGGREALMEAQRFPDDFDGIAAGAPALNFTVQNSFYHAWNALVNSRPDGSAILTAERLPLLHAAALRACDALDGAMDGLIGDPSRCDFDPHAAQCRAGQSTERCLTAEEADVAGKLYAGARDSSGRRLVVGGPMRGSELSWAGVFVPDRADATIFSATIADGSLRHLYYPQSLPASWRLRDLKFDAATLESFTYRSIYDATNPDLSAFSKRGGRLIIWHGWSDPHISPLNSIEYYDAVRRQLGSAEVQQFARLFLIPGLYHCSGGDGYAEFDILTPLLEWVETGRAPDVLHTVRPAATSASLAASAESVLLLQPYGRPGPVNSASGESVPVGMDWLGARYMSPTSQQSCAVSDGRMQCTPLH